MSEENNNPNESALTADDIKKMETDAIKAAQKERSDIVKEVEEKVKRDIEIEKQTEDLKRQAEDSTKQLEEFKLAAIEEKKKLEEAFETRLKDLEDGRKSPINTDNPLIRKENNSPRKDDILEQIKDKAVSDEIIEELREASIKQLDLPASFGRF